MSRLRLYPFAFTITHIIDAYDKRGTRCLKVKGYHSYTAYKTDGSTFKTFDNFSAIVLYGVKELLDETISRFRSSRDNRLKVDVLDADISNILRNGTLYSSLLVYYYDFKEQRFGTRKLIKHQQQQLLEERAENEEND